MLGKFSVILLVSLFSFGCKINTNIYSNSSSQQPEVNSVQLSGNTFILTGENLKNVKDITLSLQSSGGATNLTISSQSATELRLVAPAKITLHAIDELKFQLEGTAASVEKTVQVNFQSSQMQQFESEAVSDQAVVTSLFLTGDDKAGVGLSSVPTTLKMAVDGKIGANQFCDENGANCVSPSSVGTGSDPWTDNATSINYTSGFVGIGTPLPQAPLDIHSGRFQASVTGGDPQIRVYGSDTAMLTATDSASQLRGYFIDDAVNSESRIGSRRGSDQFQIGNRTVYVEQSRLGFNEEGSEATLEVSGDATTDNLFLISSTAGADGDVMIVQDTGEVGIGTTAPMATLDINGFMKLEVQTVAPSCTGGDHYGRIAITTAYRVCACSASGWVYTDDGTTTCTF